MPIDTTTFRSDLVKTKLPLLDQPELTRELIDRLKIPDEVALKPENVIPFLASQSVRYNEIVSRPEIKAMVADIPEFRYDESMEIHRASAMTREEQAAMEGWSQNVMVGLQSDPDIEKLEADIDAYIKDMMAKNPDMQSKNLDFYDASDDFLFMQGIQETIEEKKEWERKLMLAASSGSAVILNTLLGERMANSWMKALGKFTEKQAQFVEQKDKLMKDLNLDKNITQADALKANIAFGSYQGDMSENMMKINFALNEYQRITQDTARTNTEIGKPQDVMIQNTRA